MDKKLKKIIFITFLLVFAVSSYIYNFYIENNIGAGENNELILEKKELISEPKETEEKLIIVHLSGAVKNAGVYQISENDRLIDLLKAAGGLNKNADLSSINLAEYLIDGQKVIIPAENTKKVEAEFIEIKTEINSKESLSGLVNINTADIEQLTKLNGIGQSKAQAIIKYREKNGLFKNKEALINVTGIGEKTLENIRDEISIR